MDTYLSFICTGDGKHNFDFDFALALQTMEQDIFAEMKRREEEDERFARELVRREQEDKERREREDEMMARKLAGETISAVGRKAELIDDEAIARMLQEEDQLARNRRKEEEERDRKYAESLMHEERDPDGYWANYWKNGYIVISSLSLSLFCSQKNNKKKGSLCQETAPPLADTLSYIWPVILFDLIPLCALFTDTMGPPPLKRKRKRSPSRYRTTTTISLYKEITIGNTQGFWGILQL